MLYAAAFLLTAFTVVGWADPIIVIDGNNVSARGWRERVLRM
jgi:hypothetical protein